MGDIIDRYTQIVYAGLCNLGGDKTFPRVLNESVWDSWNVEIQTVSVLFLSDP